MRQGLSFWGVLNQLLPLFGTIAGVVLAVGQGVSLEAIVAAVVLIFVTGFGITVGFHRFFVHRSFKTYRPVAWLLAIFGYMAEPKSLLLWVSEHRKHHRLSDGPGDPHSPQLGGFWHAQVNWLVLRSYTFDPREVPDLLKRPDLLWLDRHRVGWYLLGLLLPALICGLIAESAFGALMGFLWGGLFRQFFVRHTTSLVNSATHLWGSKPYSTPDGSRNNFFVALFTLGEGWHNNHHAFPSSARHGLHWWQVDFSWYVIWIMARLHLAWNIRLPNERSLAAPLGTLT